MDMFIPVAGTWQNAGAVGEQQRGPKVMRAVLKGPVNFLREGDVRVGTLRWTVSAIPSMPEYLSGNPMRKIT